MAIDKLLKRHFWVVILGLVAIAAFLDAQGMTQIVGDTVALSAEELATPSLLSTLPVASAPTSAHALSAEPIISRNAFDSATGPLNAVPVALQDQTTAPAAPDLSNPLAAPDCDGVRVLVIVSSADPDWSFAALEALPESGKTMLRRRGGEIGDKTVAFVGWDRVWMTSGSHLCQSQMFKPPALASAAPAASAPPPAPAPVASGGAGG